MAEWGDNKKLSDEDDSLLSTMSAILADLADCLLSNKPFRSSILVDAFSKGFTAGTNNDTVWLLRFARAFMLVMTELSNRELTVTPVDTKGPQAKHTELPCTTAPAALLLESIAPIAVLSDKPIKDKEETAVPQTFIFEDPKVEIKEEPIEEPIFDLFKAGAKDYLPVAANYLTSAMAFKPSTKRPISIAAGTSQATSLGNKKPSPGSKRKQMNIKDDFAVAKDNCVGSPEYSSKLLTSCTAGTSGDSNAQKSSTDGKGKWAHSKKLFIEYNIPATQEELAKMPHKDFAKLPYTKEQMDIARLIRRRGLKRMSVERCKEQHQKRSTPITYVYDHAEDSSD